MTPCSNSRPFTSAKVGRIMEAGPWLLVEARMRSKITGDSLTAYAFLLPGFLFLAVWIIYPMLKALQISAYDWSIMPGQVSEFVGLDNYVRALHDGLFWLSFKNTLLYAGVTVSGQLVLGLVVALMLDQITKGRVAFRAVYYLPVVTSWVVVSLLFKYLFNASPAGLINYLLVDILHVLSAHIPWLNEPETAFVAIYSLGIWKGVGWTMVIFLAALQSIPAEYHEAASIDGASSWQIIRLITLPLLIPTMILVMIMLTIGAFQAYIQVALITGGGPLHRTEVLLSYMYDRAFTDLDFGYAAALSYVLIFVVFVISQLQLRFLRSEPMY
ncbi:MAG TPA: sugar ABC transporter permease [Chloroflexi bacterium]|nr:sugar ABC transporter permease [Chloroflexota bacterium]